MCSAATSPRHIGRVRPRAHLAQVVDALTEDPKVARNFGGDVSQFCKQPGEGQLEFDGRFRGSPVVDVEVVRKAKTVSPDNVVAPTGEIGELGGHALLSIPFVAGLDVFGPGQEFE